MVERREGRIPDIATMVCEEYFIIFDDEGVMVRITGRAGKGKNGRLCRLDVVFPASIFETVRIKYFVITREGNDLRFRTQFV